MLHPEQGQRYVTGKVYRSANAALEEAGKVQAEHTFVGLAQLEWTQEDNAGVKPWPTRH